MRSNILLMCVYLLFELVACKRGFEIGAPGVCQFTSRIRSRLKNSNKDTESARTRIACCAGWRYDAASASCQPQCRFGCSGGRCVAPDTCHCAPPLRLRAGACEPPACRQPCVHAACTDTDTCSCHPDHTPYNATHCAPLCPDGHYNDPTTLSCLPICDEPCVNARCSAPNTCTCLPGYVFKDNNTCVPECKQPCENADCVAPDTCLCRQGYVNETDWKCTPQCQSCANGDCVAPNSCRCHEGYTRVDNVCQPVCDRNCSNGVCSAPNFCTCNDGFKLDPSDPLSCVPQCEPACVNATCSAPNSCSCLSGYHKTESHWSCEPHCDGCNNGDCTAPNTCQCHTGYSKDVDGKCVPECDADCSNGYCSEPNLCTCHLGYEKRSSDPFQCHPICYPSCVNATCVAPNTCTCFDGHESTDNSSICKPKCASCNNGQCVGPDECTCNKGFTLIDGTCTPVCEDKCINGICSAPGVCSCLPGYSKNETNDNECYRPCKSCEMGTCTTGGVCICNTGFFFENDTCVSVTPIECSSCAGNCSGSPCWCPDGRPCYSLAESREMSTSPRDIATITWVFGATLGVLMVSLVCVIHWMWRRQKRNEKPSNNGDLYNSVIYTVPDTLMKRNLYGETDISAKMAEEEDQRSVEDVTEEQWPSERLLTSIEAQNNIA
ncbi:hypothetical protein JYU34_006609 [Plutella xylostella]|uniref:EGF-like domain-containing protein n=1 Tax=Plutella xylostella TaxID=51655 RepID=A0ABQ7QSF8_PLUXY|nr:hypothetical protein JYU34_006609 [Plutella xylostella]